MAHKKRLFVKIITWIIIIFMVLAILSPFISYIFPDTTTGTIPPTTIVP